MRRQGPARRRQALVNAEQRAAEIDLDRLDGWPGLHHRLCEQPDSEPPPPPAVRP